MAEAQQQSAAERAVNYFTLLDLMNGNQGKTSDLWQQLIQGFDLTKPFEAEALLPTLGRLDVDKDAIDASRQSVVRGLKLLRPEDRIVERGDHGYPKLLATVAGAPQFLFVRQRENVLDEPSLSIVGSRHASREGLLRARKLAHLLVKRGISVVSGLARGIDQAAHSGALEIGGITIAVIGTPLSRYYPAEHRELQERIGLVGAVVSQFPPSSKTLPLCFPMRNATMSGMTLGTVVVEASETSGALIQARRCLEQGRQLFIPKSAIDDPRLSWPKTYHKRGAHVFSNIDELIIVLEQKNLIPPQSEKAPALPVSIGADVS